MEKTNPNDDVLIQFFDAVKTCDVKTARTILKNNPTIVNEVNPVTNTTALDEAVRIDIHSIQTNEHRPDLVKLLLRFGAHIEKTYLTRLLCGIQGHSHCKNQIAHLLFSFGVAMDSGDDDYYKNDPESVLKIWEDEDHFERINNKRLVEITEAHICTRLYIAIENGDENEVQRLVQKYDLTIDNPLPCYDHISNYGTTSALTDSKDMPLKKIIPLHYAVICNQDAIVRILVEKLHADVNVKNEIGKTVFDYEPNNQIVAFLLSHGADPKNPDPHNQISMNYIHWTFADETSDEMDSIHSDSTFESSQEIEDEVEKTEIETIKNFQVPEVTVEEKTDTSTDNANTITDNYNNNPEPNPIENIVIPLEPIRASDEFLLENNPPQKPEPLEGSKEPINNNDPVKNPTTLLTNNTLPWKWIGAGIAVAVVIVAAKKLYNWWHTRAEPQQELNESEPESEPQPLAAVHG